MYATILTTMTLKFLSKHYNRFVKELWSEGGVRFMDPDMDLYKPTCRRFLRDHIGIKAEYFQNKVIPFIAPLLKKALDKQMSNHRSPFRKNLKQCEWLVICVS